MYNISSKHSIDTVTIRLAREADADALARLAQLDTAEVPRGPVLVATSGEQMLVAMSLEDGTLIADPFVRTAEIASVVRHRARQMRKPRRLGSLRRRRRTPHYAPRPAGAIRPGASL